MASLFRRFLISRARPKRSTTVAAAALSLLQALRIIIIIILLNAGAFEE